MKTYLFWLTSLLKINLIASNSSAFFKNIFQTFIKINFLIIFIVTKLISSYLYIIFYDKLFIPYI